MQGFLKTLSEVDNGALIEDCLVELNHLVDSVRDTGRKGKFTLELEIEPLKGDSFVLTISGKPVIKLPATRQHTSIMYPLEGGNLSRKDPRQPDIFELRSVDDDEVDPETGEVKIKAVV